MTVKNVGGCSERENGKKNRQKLLLTCICLDTLEFVFVDICEERSPGLVSGVVAARSHVTCPSLTKTCKYTDKH